MKKGRKAVVRKTAKKLVKKNGYKIKSKKPIQPAIRLVLNEIDAVLSKIKQESVEKLVMVLSAGRRVITIGAGRVGLATKGFAMRLGHLGIAAYALGDMTVPSLGVRGDVVIVASGSGETPSIALLAETAKQAGATLVLLTGNPESRMGKIADIVVHIPAPNKASGGAVRSKQPMTTLNEQCLQIFFDALVLVLMHELGENHDTMHARHSNLE